MDCPLDDDRLLFETEFSFEDTMAYVEECLNELPHDPRFFTTSVAVTDLEAIRKALGYSALNLYGVSYGSRVAQHFARQYPQSTRTVVIDGVVPPQIALGPEIVYVRHFLSFAGVWRDRPQDSARQMSGAKRQSVPPMVGW